MILRNSGEPEHNIELEWIENLVVTDLDLWQDGDVITLSCTHQARELVAEIEKWIRECEQ